MEPKMQLQILKVKEIIEGKQALLREKSFNDKDCGDIFPREAIHKIIEYLNMSIQKLSHTLTKTTILLSERPLPKSEEMAPLYDELSQELNQFYEISTTFYPLYCGALLKQTYKQACLDILEAIGEVINEMYTNVYNKEKLLKANGFVWETCQKFQSLPCDLIQFFFHKCQSEYDSLVDAEEELKNEIKEHQESDFNFEETSWSEDDLKLLTPTSGLIKTCHSLCKKLKQCASRGRLDTKDHVDEIERMCRAVLLLSPLVDDLVTNLYPPLVKKQVFSSANSLLSALKSLLSMIASIHFITIEDMKWVDFLKSATEHNGTKLLDNLSYSTTEVASQMTTLNIT